MHFLCSVCKKLYHTILRNTYVHPFYINSKLEKIVDGELPKTHECNSKEETFSIKEANYETNRI